MFCCIYMFTIDYPFIIIYLPPSFKGQINPNQNYTVRDQYIQMIHWCICPASTAHGSYTAFPHCDCQVRWQRLSEVNL